MREHLLRDATVLLVGTVNSTINHLHLIRQSQQSNQATFPFGYVQYTTALTQHHHANHSTIVFLQVYIQSDDLPANRHYPITQSYLDIIMRGCLSISTDFARRFLETTSGWWHDGKSSTHVSDEDHSTDPDHHTWVNDRHDPMYIRADSEYSVENGAVIDKLIEEHHSDALKRRVTSM